MPDWNPDDFEPIGGQGGTATAAPVTWNPDDFEAAPDLSKVQMDPYQRATVARGGIKPETGMEAGTDFTAALAQAPSQLWQAGKDSKIPGLSSALTGF